MIPAVSKNFRLWIGAVSILVLMLGLAESQPAHARQAGDFGLHFTVASDPFPGILGVNLLYHIDPHWRIQAGAGTMLFLGASTGVGVRYIATPEPGFSPVFGLSWTRLSIDGIEGIPFFDWSDGPEISQHYSVYAGYELATAGGFLFGLGFTAIFAQVPAHSIGATVMPGLYLGWLF